MKEQSDQNKNPTIRDVAEYAGVSVGSVSNVINGKDVSAAVEKKVYAAMRALEYRRNSIASGLRTGRTRIVGAILPDFRHEFYGLSLSGFIEQAHQDGYTVFATEHQFNPEQEECEIRRLLEYRADGIVFFNGFGDIALIKRLHKEGVPVVLADRRIRGIPLPFVNYANTDAIKNAVSYLAETGARRIGLLTCPLILQNHRERYLGYVRGLQECGLVFLKENVLIAENAIGDERKAAYEMMKKIVRSRAKKLPEALIAIGLELTLGAMTLLADEGLRMPEDVRVIGLNGGEQAAQTVRPALSGVYLDPYLLGRASWHLMRGALKSEPPAHLVIRPEFRLRDSG